MRPNIDGREERVLARTLGSEGRWIARSYIGRRGERSIIYKSLETSPLQMRFKNLEGKLEKESSKRTISTSNGL